MPAAVSTRYAKALVDAVLDGKSQMNGQQAQAELESFAGLMRESPELNNVLMSPAVSGSKKRAVVGRFADQLPLSRLVRNFLFVLIDRRRISMLGDIVAAFAAELDARTGVVRAEVTSATELNDAQRQQMQDALGRLTGKQVRAQFAVDRELIGGAVARIGSTIYDGSVKGQLTELRSRLVSQ